jgi:hypothetical protein
VPSEVLLAVLACTVACWVPGVPLALLVLRRTDATAGVVLATAAATGLGAWMLVGLPAVHQGWFSPVPLVLAVGAVSAVAWIPARHQAHRLRPGRPGWLGAYLAVLAVPALWLRSSPIYFAYQVADFGEYVNRGNVIAAGGPFGGWFVNGFPLVMAEASLLLGEARSVHVMPFLGLLVGVVALAALRLAGAGPVIVAVTALPFALHVHPVWFSQFPASETLYAALLVTSMLLAVAALVGQDRAVAASAVAVGFLLVVTRGNGLVYLPLVAAGVALVPVFTDRARGTVLRVHLLALAGGLWLGSVYDARHNPTYFLDQQAVPRLPGPLADSFGRLNELPVAALATVVVTAGLAVATFAGMLVGRVHQRPGWLRALRVATIGAVAATVLVVHAVVITPESYINRYEGLGAPVWIAAGLALAVWCADGIRDGVVRFLVGWPLVTALALATFQASRMRKSLTIDAHWFLYWDRYFFSEAFPLLVLAGAAAAVAVASRFDGAGTAVRRSLQGALAAVVVVSVVDMVPPTRRATERAMFEDTYEELAAIDALMPDDLPVVYDGLVEHPEHWFWPNSSRVLGNPLAETFGHRILNLAAPLAPDGRPEPEEVADALEHRGAARGYVLQVRPEPVWRDFGGGRLEAEVRGEVVVPIERLEGRSFVRPERQPWIVTTLHVRVVEVALVRSPA